MGTPCGCPCSRPRLRNWLAVTHGTGGELVIMDPKDGIIRKRHTGSLTTGQHVLITDGLAYVGDNSIKYFNYAGYVDTMTTVQCANSANPWGQFQISQAAAVLGGREMLCTTGIPARRYSFTAPKTGTLEATYVMPATTSDALDQCTGIEEDNADDIVCSFLYRSNRRVWCAGYDRDPSSGTDVTANWSYPGGNAAAPEAIGMARIRLESSGTYVAAMTPSAIASTISRTEATFNTFAATGSAFGSIITAIKIHDAPYSDHWNEEPSSSTSAKQIRALAVAAVPGVEGDFYGTTQPALDDGDEYSVWRIGDDGTLKWRYSDPDDRVAYGRLSTDPDSGDLFCGWYDYLSVGSPFDYGIRRHDKTTGEVVWSTTLVSGATIPGFVAPGLNDSFCGQMFKSS